jgi:VanZ family protein
MQKSQIARVIFYFSLLCVFFLSVVNANDIPRFNALSFISDKFIHFIIYFYLAYLGLLCKFRISDYSVVFMVFIFGLFIEIIHFYHPYRFFEYFDLLANLIGVTIALLVGRLKN